MAKKDRVPTPPKRPVQAPKAYHAEPNPRRTRLIFIIVAAAIVIGAAAVGTAFILSGDDSSAAGTSVQGDCTFETFDALEASHVPELPDGYEYNSAPATSGLHNATTAIWNLYDQSVPQINYVHNLEHGGVVVQYGSEVPAEDIAGLADWYGQDTRGLIVAPLGAEFEEADPTLAGEIVATSWTHMLRCGSFDEEALSDFVDDYRGPQGDAPEKFELDLLQQGAN